MDDNSDKCLWLMEMFIFCCLSLSLAFASVTTYLSLKSDYLPRQYEKNWNMNYLIDVIPTKNRYCPEGYQTKVIGKWSGFHRGCYCSNNETGIQIATEEECSETLNDIFSCYPLMGIKPQDLVRYKGFQFCVKRANDNYISLFRKVDRIYSESENRDSELDKDNNNYNYNTTDYNDSYKGSRNNIKDFSGGFYEKYSDYIKILLNSAPPNYLDENAIIDLKLLDTKMFNISDISQKTFDLSKYEEKKINNTNYSLFILRLRALNRPQNIFDLQKVLVDIHLYNELWCAYLDLSSTYLKSKFSKEDINYGDIDYCEDFYLKHNSTLTFNDNFVNSIRLNFEFDNSASLFDFYDWNGITDFYNHLKTQDPSNNPKLIKNSMYRNFEPIMTAQKYFMGIGCLYSKDPENHIKVLNANFILARLSGAIAFLLICCVFIGFLYVCAKARERDCFSFRNNVMFLLFVLMFICLLGSFAVDLLARQTLLYLQDYMIYCQTDFSNSQDNNALKVSDMENNLYELLLFIYRVSGSTSTALALGCIMLFMFLCRECGKKPRFEPSVQLGRNVGINQFDISGMPYNANPNALNSVSNRNFENNGQPHPPMEIEIKVIEEKYNSNSLDSHNYKDQEKKQVDNSSSFAAGNKDKAYSRNYLNNNSNSNKTNTNTPQGNFGYSNNLNDIANNANNDNANNFDHTGFQFSEGDKSRKAPAAFSTRDPHAEGNEISGVTDRSNINLNKF